MCAAPRSLITDDVRAITDNLTEAMRFFGRARDNGRVSELPGAAVIYCGLDYAAFNAAVLSHPVAADAAALERSINDPADYFESRNLRWSYWYCDDYIGKAMERRARMIFDRHHMIELTQAPGMIANRLAPSTRSLPPLDIKPVTDVATRSAFAHITSIAFEVPWTICREIYGSERAWQGTFQGFVGYLNGTAIVSTAAVVTAEVAGIYSVGTLPGHRGRGYAEKLMRHVLAVIQEETGVERTVLQSTRSGQNLYTRMGYRQITNYTVFITD